MQGFGERFGEGNIRDICAEATNAGINFYDTAEVYGYQRNNDKESSEYIVGRCAFYLTWCISIMMRFCFNSDAGFVQSHPLLVR